MTEQTAALPPVGAWDFWIDRGGTFTDVVARDPAGALHAKKLLSENPERYEDAALQAIREFLGLGAREQIPLARIGAVKMGTTVATNALLEKKGAPTVLVTTRGLKDQLRLAYQNRPDAQLFARDIRLPEQLYGRVIEASERVTADGRVMTPLDEVDLRDELEGAKGLGFEAVAIVFLHAYRFPAHEARAAEIAAELGFRQISASHAVSPLMKMVGRGDTTVVDAYLSPILRAYVDRVAAAFDGASPRALTGKLMFMTSAGGLTDARRFQGKDAILSGPAGGVVGGAKTAEIAGLEKVLGFDMGGTSTDVWRYDGQFERTYSGEIAGVRIRAPMMNIHTVAAGGGSLLVYDGQRMRVGPDSAGADPGPTCYGRGGPLAVTDANVLTGKLRPEFFPMIFGPDADAPLDLPSTQLMFNTMARKINADNTARGQAAKSPVEIAEGFLQIAVENMAAAIKKISVQRGYDVSDHALTVFGGAGAQHACLVADALGVDTCLVHPMASLLSAYGMGLADIRANREQAIEARLDDESRLSAAALLDQLAMEASQEVAMQGVAREAINTVHTLYVKIEGTDTALPVSYGANQEIRDAFNTAHRARFGFDAGERPLVIEAVSAEAIGRAADLSEPDIETAERTEEEIETALEASFFTSGDWASARYVRRAAMRPGDRLTGPAVIVEPHTSIVIEPGWRAEITGKDHIVLRRATPRPDRRAIGAEADPAMLEVFNNLYMSIAEQMGAVLENTASSVTIKERLDFSCAVFNAAGDLIANAPHMPVHLGSMNASVKTVIAQNPEIKPGDAFALNAPYNGGTHLPDITVVAPVWDADKTKILFFTASRGHHTDIGGLTPGSMPPDSRSIHDEGVYIDNFKLVDQGKFDEDGLRTLLTEAQYPARNPDLNVADLKAQLAACEKGAQELTKMVAQFGLETVSAYMRHVQDNAEESVRRAISALKDAEYVYPMDPGFDGEEREIRVKITVDHASRSATVDFTGTTPQTSTNYNAPEPVTRAAVLYVFRCLVDDSIPMNEGVMKPLNVVLPKGTMLSPEYPAAIIAGNVETSQCVTNALFLALRVMGGAQGTMNNTTWGNERHQYYETVCGGAGAGILNDGSGHHGASGVHTHMTNSRLTDPEVLEWRFPVLLEEFRLRPGSGGGGKFRGGDGTVRRTRFLEPMTVALLSGHRDTPPPGLDGGDAGAVGRTRIYRVEGGIIELEAADKTEVEAGDVLELETPGGGGCGKI
ncbi:MAG: hydantoinase B/oxoprolinase family protein [Rhodobacteraceae bacterium]|nr:hydantoinase B/oxoprolinase family protein [Paracoccaceae bacterium]